MIIFVICNSCLQRFEVTVGPEDRRLLAELCVEDEELKTAPCPRQCGGRINLEDGPEFRRLWQTLGLRDPMALTVTELYQAVHGLPLPDEVPKGVEVVGALLLASRVANAVLDEQGSRIYLHALELENGFTIHLSRGLLGAQVLKVTRPIKEAA